MGDVTAVIADIHGNTWALDAVLADIGRRGAARVVNLGDCAWGSLDPAGTLVRLAERAIPTVSGNQDRTVHAPSPADAATDDYRFLIGQLSSEQLEWLRRLPAELRVGGIYCCHATPASDVVYMLEEVTPEGVRLRDGAAVEAMLAGIAERVVVCGHSHVPRVVMLPGGRLVVNPGSVGIPAYDDDLPLPHVMESGSPHARYALLQETPAGWRAELVAVPYDWEAAAAVAERRGRPDRAAWIRTGRAALR